MSMVIVDSTGSLSVSFTRHLITVTKYMVWSILYLYKISGIRRLIPGTWQLLVCKGYLVVVTKYPVPCARHLRLVQNV